MSQQLRTITYNTAKMLTPIDTGFMRHTGVRLQPHRAGWNIKWDYKRVPYIKYLNEGTAPHGKHEAFVSRAIVAVVDEVMSDAIGKTTTNKKNIQRHNKSLKYEKRQHEQHRRKLKKLYYGIR